jgi:hypothetical protein
MTKTYLRVVEVNWNSKEEDAHEHTEKLSRVVSLRCSHSCSVIISKVRNTVTHQHIRAQVVPCVYHGKDSKGSSCLIVRLCPLARRNGTLRLTERDNVLCTDHKHKCWARVARICLSCEVSRRDDTDDKPELVESPS